MSSDDSTGPTPPSALAIGALAALKRARKRAEEIAAATGTALVQWEDGKIVYVYPGRSDPPRTEREP